MDSNQIWYVSIGLLVLLIIQQHHPTVGSIQQSNQASKHHLYATKTSYHQAYYKLLNNSFQINNYKPPEQCKPKLFYMICRHATRYPSKKKITKMQARMYAFRDRLIANSTLNADQIKQFKNWQLRMQLNDDNRISDTGFQETRQLGKI